MADAAAHPPKPSYDAQGREVFTVHPAILSGGAPYRKVTEPPGTEDARPATTATRPRPASDVDR